MSDYILLTIKHVVMPIEETAKGKCRIPRTDAAPRKERYYARQNQMKGKIA